MLPSDVKVGQIYEIVGRSSCPNFENKNGKFIKVLAYSGGDCVDEYDILDADKVRVAGCAFCIPVSSLKALDDEKKPISNSRFLISYTFSGKNLWGEAFTEKDLHAGLLKLYENNDVKKETIKVYVVSDVFAPKFSVSVSMTNSIRKAVGKKPVGRPKGSVKKKVGRPRKYRKY